MLPAHETPCPIRRLRSRPWLSTLAAALLMTSALAGCSGNDPVAPLDVTWEASLIEGVDQVLDVSGDSIVAVSASDLVQLDQTTGEQQGRFDTPRLCEVTTTSGENPTVAAVWGANCRTIGVIDVDQRDWAWQATLPHGTEFDSGESLAASESTVSVITGLAGKTVRRYAVADGRVLETLGGESDQYVTAASDGHTIAITTRDDDGETHAEVYDADTATLLWVSTPETDLTSVTDVISSDPLILTATEGHHEVMWQLDANTGTRLHPLGPQEPGMQRTIGVVNGVLVVADQIYDSDVSGYDLETGTQLWDHIPYEGTLAGLGADGSMIVVNSAGAFDENADVVTRHSLHDPSEFDVIGAVGSGASGSSTTLIGDTLFFASYNDLYAVNLPAEPQDVEVSYTDPYDGRWEDGEVRPEGGVACRAPEDELTRLGFHRVELGPMKECWWEESQEPEGIARYLRIQYHVHTPDDASATDNAKSRIAEDIDVDTDELGFEGGEFVEVDGLGDEAYVSMLAKPDGHALHLSVRVRNATAILDITSTSRDPLYGPVSGAAMEYAAVEIARSLFEQDGLTLTIPESFPERASLSAPDDICERIGQQLRTLVPRGTIAAQTPAHSDDPATSGCVRSSENASAAVTAYVVPESTLTHQSGEELATQAMAEQLSAARLRRQPISQMPDLGDEAHLLLTYTYQYVVRVGDTLFQISYFRTDASESVLLYGVETLAQQVVAAYS